MRLWQLTKGIVSEPFEACVQFDAVCDKLVSNEKGRKWNVLCWIVWEKDKTKMISPWKNAFDLLKRITKRTEMMFYFDFDHFFSLSIQTLSTSFRYTRKIVWFNSIMLRKKNKSQMESVEGIVTQVVHETISHEEWSFSPIWSMNETLQVILIFFKASE